MNRKCGSCTLCCKLVPTAEIGKPANTRCKHQRHSKGCAIYAQRPWSCQVWNCRWLLEDDTADQRRPDLSHIVIDVMPDFVTLQYTDRPPRKIPVLQCWVDPLYPDAHRAPEFRAYLLRQGAQGLAAIIRYSADDGFVLFPPNLAADGKWHEERGGQSSGRTHDMFETAAAFVENGMKIEMRIEDR